MLKTKIANREYKTCIYNASGVNCRSKQNLDELYLSNSAIVLSKSCTIQERKGNMEPRYFDTETMSINSSGLPNMGYNFYNTISDSSNGSTHTGSVRRKLILTAS